MHRLKFREAQVLVVDNQLYVRKLMQDALRAVGFAAVEGCADIGGLLEVLEIETPDLIFIDIDRGLEATCKTLQDIRNGRLGSDPFVVIVALTWNPKQSAVAAALTAGADDLLAKPVSAQILRDRVVRQVESRKEFVVTTTYIGPDRRGPERPKSKEDLPTIPVPNNLRFKTAGDAKAESDPKRIEAAMRSLNVQLIYRLSRQIGATASGAANNLRDGTAERVPADALRRMEDDLDRAEVLTAALEIPGLADVLATARASLDSIAASGGRVPAREVELVCLNGLAIGSALREQDESGELLATALKDAAERMRPARSVA